MIDSEKISACSTEYKVCDSYTSFTRQQTRHSSKTMIYNNEHLNDSPLFISGFVYQIRSGLKSTNVTYRHVLMYHISMFLCDLRMINMSSECEYDWFWKNISLNTKNKSIIWNTQNTILKIETLCDYFCRVYH
jgi:hypothetical protein